MVVLGEWRVEQDGISRPMVEVSVLIQGCTPLQERFLVDTGADNTIFSATLLESLGLPLENAAVGSVLQGIGGECGSIIVEATLSLFTVEKVELTIRGNFAAVVGQSTLDVSILGRDVLSHFDVIVSRRRNEVLILTGNHAYAVTG